MEPKSVVEGMCMGHDEQAAPGSMSPYDTNWTQGPSNKRVKLDHGSGHRDLGIDGASCYMQSHNGSSARPCTADSLLGGAANDLRLEIVGLDRGTGMLPLHADAMQHSVNNTHSSHLTQTHAPRGLHSSWPVRGSVRGSNLSNDESFASHDYYVKHEQPPRYSPTMPTGACAVDGLRGMYDRDCQRDVDPFADFAPSANINPLINLDVGGYCGDQGPLSSVFDMDVGQQQQQQQQQQQHAPPQRCATVSDPGSALTEPCSSGQQVTAGDKPPRRKRMSGLSEDMRRERRRQSNRESARRSRARKIEEVRTHEDRISDLGGQLQERTAQLQQARTHGETLKEMVHVLEGRCQEAHSQLLSLVRALSEEEGTLGLSDRFQAQLANVKAKLMGGVSRGR